MKTWREMTPDEKRDYATANLRSLPAELVEEAADILIAAGEVEYAAVLCRDHNQISQAIGILVDHGDYLWAAQIARNSGQPSLAQEILSRGLDFYLAGQMYGRAASAATALHLPAESIEAIVKEGIAYESQGMDLSRAQAALDSLATSIAHLDRDDQITQDFLDMVHSRMPDHTTGDQQTSHPYHELDQEPLPLDLDRAARSSKLEQESNEEEEMDGDRFC